VSLAAVLMVATAGLFSWANIATIRRISVREFWIAMAATVGVVAVGVMNAILIAVMLAIVSYLQLAARPKVNTLGKLPGQPGFHPISEHASANAPPGLILFRFDGPIIFFNAAYFKQEVYKAAAAAGPDLKWFVVDLLPVNMIDATGVYTILEVFEGLRSRGVVTGVAARDAAWVSRMVERGFADRQLPYRVFVTLRQASRAYRSEVLRAAPSAPNAD
jgi:MFS superfamily sulfate permease-like transporter